VSRNKLASLGVENHKPRNAAHLVLVFESHTVHIAEFEGVLGDFSKVRGGEKKSLLCVNGRRRRRGQRFSNKGQTTTKQSASRLVLVVGQSKRTRRVQGSMEQNV